jgi:hypothetical protein
LVEFLPASVGTLLLDEKPHTKRVVMAFKSQTVNMANLPGMGLQKVLPSSLGHSFQQQEGGDGLYQGRNM